jgi:hypothetical protein
MPVLSIVNNFEMVAQGLTVNGKQGLAASLLSDAFDITVSGYCHRVLGTLATAAVQSVWDDAGDVPATWSYLFYVADQNSYLQLITAAANCIIKCTALEPQVLTTQKILAAANTTPITGGSEPVGVVVKTIYAGNYSGTTLSYAFAVIL